MHQNHERVTEGWPYWASCLRA